MPAGNIEILLTNICAAGYNPEEVQEMACGKCAPKKTAKAAPKKKAPVKTKKK